MLYTCIQRVCPHTHARTPPLSEPRSWTAPPCALRGGGLRPLFDLPAADETAPRRTFPDFRRHWPKTRRGTSSGALCLFLLQLRERCHDGRFLPGHSGARFRVFGQCRPFCIRRILLRILLRFRPGAPGKGVRLEYWISADK